ncbi:MAG: hypothetical protein ACK5XV_02090 [Flavobacteriales bacterium]
MKTKFTSRPGRLRSGWGITIRQFVSALALLMICWIMNHASAQTYCTTPANTANAFFDWNSAMRSSQNNQHYCLRVYMHVIRMSNGTGGQSVPAVNQAFQILQQDFQPHQIYFQWDGTIDYIDNDSYYNNSGPYIFSINNHSDGIDIYLYHDQASPGGMANGIGNSSEFYVSGSFWDPPYDGLVTSHVISHEMGHVLFLWHTHHGTFSQNTPSECPELVNGSNGLYCGDLVPDTPADPHLLFNVNPVTCNWIYSEVDANGDFYNPDEHNIMSYSHPDCMDYFSPMQGERMRNAIEALPFLQACIVSNCPNCNSSATADLMIKDSQNDLGDEPNMLTTYMWTSEDIWVRHQEDDEPEHQNPEYHPSDPNQVYVRVVNRSCAASEGTEELHLYWAKAATSLAWDYHWAGNAFPGTNTLMGNIIGSVTIPVIGPGDEVILNLPWLVPDPAEYSSINAEPWHFCLLARIVSGDDPMTTPETADLNINTRNNNNIAWKNITVLDVQSNSGIDAAIGVYNFSGQEQVFRLDFEPEFQESGQKLFEEAEITVILDNVLMNAWESGGKTMQNVRSLGNNELLVTGQAAGIGNLYMQPGQAGSLVVKVNFLTKEASEKTHFTYHIIQRTMDDGTVIGGETIHVRKTDRPHFAASTSGKLEVLAHEPIVIEAEDIHEAATYNWYNIAGQLIYVGRELHLSSTVAEKYRLEVISEFDGFKDYSEVEVKMRPSSIDLITPNPADDQTLIRYTLNGVTSAYLMMMSYPGGGDAIYNFVLDTTQSTIELNTTDLSPGLYTIALVCDGVISDASILSVQ